jgi:chaperone protein EcpD
MQVKMKLRRAMTALLLSSLVGSAYAGVVVGGTRVVYPEKDGEVTVKLTNEGSTPALVQAWLDTGNAHSSPDEVNVPFTLTPPLFRLDPKKGQSLRMIYTQEPLAKDKETLFWLNVLDIPPRTNDQDAKSSANQLQLAIRTRIKVFFRPAGLAGEADSAPAKVNWKLVRKSDNQYALQAVNPTPYYVTLSKVAVHIGGADLGTDDGGMVAPGATVDFNLGKATPPDGTPLKIDYSTINDYGGSVSGTANASLTP